MKHSLTSNNTRNTLFKINKSVSDRVPYGYLIAQILGKHRVACVNRLPEFWMNSTKMCWFDREDWFTFYVRGDAMADFLMNFDVAGLRITEME